MTGSASPGGDRVPAAEVIAALSLATDMGLGIELEHGLRSTLIAMGWPSASASIGGRPCRPITRACSLTWAALRTVRRAALVHDVGRVAVPVRVWQKPGPLTAGEWERVRLHAYHSERVLCRSPFLEALTPVATAHHERLDGSGDHRGIGASGLAPAARLPGWSPRENSRWPAPPAGSSVALQADPWREGAPDGSQDPVRDDHRAARGGRLPVPPRPRPAPDRPWGRVGREKPEGAQRSRTTLRFAHGKGRETIMRFTTVDPGRTIGFEGRVGPLRPVGDFSFARDAGRTRLTVRVAPNPAAPLKLLSPLVNRVGQRVWDHRLARIKAALERG